MHVQKRHIVLILALIAAVVLAACTGPAPTPTATTAPTDEPTAVSQAPTEEPTEEPTVEPTEEPTAVPAEEPTATPAAEPEAPAAEATAAPAEESALSPLEGVTWQVAEYMGADGAMATPVADATVSFQNGRVSGNAGCNGFFAGYTLDGTALSVTQAGSTLMACEEAVMAQELAVLTNLTEVASYAVVDDQVQLLNAEGTAVLVLAPQAAPTLAGVVWQATNYNNGREAVVGMLEGTEITAIFGDDGSLSGSAGCNNYITGYSVDGDQITIELAATTMMMCAEPEGIMEQEAAYLAALTTAATFSINGDVLEMRTADDAMAVLYRVDTASVVIEPTASADPDPVVEDAAAAPIEFAAAAAAATPSGRVTAPAGVNIRMGPGTQYPIVGVAPLDAQGEIIGRSADSQWWVARVPSAPDEQGWVAAAYVEASNAGDVPALPAPPLPVVTAAIQEGKPYVPPQNVILYSASRRVLEGNRAYELEDIYAVPSTPGSQPEMVANNAMQPALSPDRNTLAFWSQRNDKLGLGGHDVNTGQRLRFSRFIEDSSPRWSPSGDRIVFASNRQGDRRWRIYITPAVAQENPANMTYTEVGFGKDPDWHPSQELFIVKGCDDQGQSCGMYTMNADGSGRAQFTNVTSDSMPRWLPDGSAVVFMSEGRDGNWEIYRASTADGAVTRLTNDPAPDGLPAVSPDGQQIAFISKRGGTWGLWVMPVAGGDATQIAPIQGDLPDWLMQAVDWPR